MKYTKKFQNHTEYEAYTADTTNFILPNVSYCVQEDEAHCTPVPRDYSKEYFTIESLEDNNTINIQNVNCNTLPTFYYSLDDGQTWSSVEMTKGSTLSIATLDTGEKVMFKSTNRRVSETYNSYNKFNGSKDFIVYGNVMSLIKGDDFEQNSEFPSSATGHLAGIFYSTTTLTDAGNLILPAMTIPFEAYNCAFRGCTGLKVAPKLPATTFLIGGSNGNGSNYSSMFEGCINLEEAPELPATNLVRGCYHRMFCMSRTTKLTTPKMTKAPVLPALTVPENEGSNKPGAYEEMFKGNGNLVEVTCMAETFSTNSCKDWLLNGSYIGTFKKAAGATWETGTSGIPSGWTVEDYDE